jgi:TPR repeat protein
MLRDNWLAVVQENYGIYQVVYFSFEGQETGPMPGIRATPPPPLTPEQIAAQKAKDAAAKKSGEERALKMNQDLADKGDAYGLLRMGERYRDGDGVAKNLPKAREYFTKAVAAGSPSAQEELDSLPSSTK